MLFLGEACEVERLSRYTRRYSKVLLFSLFSSFTNVLRQSSHDAEKVLVPIQMQKVTIELQKLLVPMQRMPIKIQKVPIKMQKVPRKGAEVVGAGADGALSTGRKNIIQCP